MACMVQHCFFICSYAEDMTARVAQKGGLVASALTRRLPEGDNLFFGSFVVTLHVLGSHFDFPLFPKCFDLPALRLPCFLVHQNAGLF